MSAVKESNGTVGHATNGSAAAETKSKPTIANNNNNNNTEELPDLDPSNPYHFPAFGLPTGLHLDGARVMKCPVKDDPLTHVQKIQNLTLREDDIIVTAYPKCGE
ncbi:hypothetical protein ElyMa_001585200 [Elysia marginata]|uniref:Uncharacterized protein n=1 Tax=Elysia marginata TaxID=1093978 RepID=A0AAV4JGX4_9GAST|nr:hypothetical protein ElyMa_001585200 [Elysia marginata]